MTQFIVTNWYLFAALGVIIFLLLAGPVSQRLYGIRNANPAQTVQLLNRDNAIVVDVCEPGEFSKAHIAHAFNMPLASLKSRLPELEKHKGRPIIVSCRTGNRSLKGAVILRKHGFEQVYTLVGGLQGWERDNLPVEK